MGGYLDNIVHKILTIFGLKENNQFGFDHTRRTVHIKYIRYMNTPINDCIYVWLKRSARRLIGISIEYSNVNSWFGSCQQAVAVY